MAAVGCNIKTISLKAGEQFVLPQGAELLSSSDKTKITSTCGEITIADTECFLVYFGESNGPGSVTYSDIYIDGVIISGTKYNFLTSYSPLNVTGTNPALVTGLMTRLDELGIGGLFQDACGWSDTDSSGTIANMVFKTTPSVGLNISFTGIADTTVAGMSAIPITFPVLQYADGFPGQHFCECETVLN